MNSMSHSTRRTFLKSATALTGGLFAPNLLLAKDASAALNVAAIGCSGKGAQRHL